MPLAGKVLLPREFAAYAAEEWPGDELPKAVATGMGESALYVGAWHDNEDQNGIVTSRDSGIMEINLPASAIGTDQEFVYRTESKDFADYDQVVKNSIVKARALYDESWTRKGKADIRRWQAWFAYTEGWATFPEWWSWNEPHKLWHATGRYIQKALVGCANYHLVIKQDKNESQALDYAHAQAARFGVKGVLDIKNGLVHWQSFPPCPTEPPADGHGPRPKPNSGV